jgi:hypothetical protein
MPIELPPVTEQTEGLVNEPYYKMYFFNPYTPPYALEKPTGMYIPLNPDLRQRIPGDNRMHR